MDTTVAGYGWSINWITIGVVWYRMRCSIALVAIWLAGWFCSDATDNVPAHPEPTAILRKQMNTFNLCVRSIVTRPRSIGQPVSERFEQSERSIGRVIVIKLFVDQHVHTGARITNIERWQLIGYKRWCPCWWRLAPRDDRAASIGVPKCCAHARCQNIMVISSSAARLNWFEPNAQQQQPIAYN